MGYLDKFTMFPKSGIVYFFKTENLAMQNMTGKVTSQEFREIFEKTGIF